MLYVIPNTHIIPYYWLSVKTINYTLNEHMDFLQHLRLWSILNQYKHYSVQSPKLLPRHAYSLSANKYEALFV